MNYLVKKIAKLSCVFILLLGVCLIRTPLNVKAATSDYVVGVNSYVYDVDNNYVLDHLTSTTSSNTIYSCYYSNINQNIVTRINYEIVLNDYYVGSMNVTFRYGNNSVSKTIYVNGNSVSYMINIKNLYYDNGLSISAEINSTNLTLYDGDYHVYVDNYNGHVVVDNFKYDFPFESYNFVSYNLQNNTLYESSLLSNYTYPSFNIVANGGIYRSTFQKNVNYDLILIINKAITNSNYTDYIELGNAIVDDIIISDSFHFANTSSRIVHIKFHFNSNVNHIISLKQASVILPIFCNRSNTYLSTEFARTFGLTNSEIEYYDGNSQSEQSTQESQQSIDNLKDSNNDFIDSSDQLENIENSYNESMNDSLDDIDTSAADPLHWDNKFISTATWVRQQFDSLTSSTVYGSMITFSLTIGLALLVIGRLVH